MRAAERTFTLSSTVTTSSQKTWLIKVLIFYVQNDLKLVDSLIPKIFPGGYTPGPPLKGAGQRRRGVRVGGMDAPACYLWPWPGPYLATFRYVMNLRFRV